MPEGQGIGDGVFHAGVGVRQDVGEAQAGFEAVKIMFIGIEDTFYGQLVQEEGGVEVGMGDEPA